MAAQTRNRRPSVPCKCISKHYSLVTFFWHHRHSFVTKPGGRTSLRTPSWLDIGEGPYSADLKFVSRRASTRSPASPPTVGALGPRLEGRLGAVGRYPTVVLAVARAPGCAIVVVTGGAVVVVGGVVVVVVVGGIVVVVGGTQSGSG